MFISTLTINHFKSFSSETTFKFIDGLNYIVGDNNCGKSTIFDALNYLVSRPSDVTSFQNISSAEVFYVEAIIEGAELEKLVEQSNFKRLEPYLDTHNQAPCFRIRRSEEKRSVTQGNKEVDLDGKKITFWNPKTSQFENPTGIDALFKKMCDIVVVSADTTTKDVADFSSTKTLGKLLAASTASFRETQSWTEFVKAHNKAFSSGDDSLTKRATELTSAIEEVVTSQYGETKIRLDFTLPDTSAFIKYGDIMITDRHYETSLADKGTGLQRAVTLALIQVWAEQENSSKPMIPLTLLLDEPETWLHPRAQLTLAKALSALADKRQLFLITHSPYMLRSFDKDSHKLLVFKSPNASSSDDLSSNGAGCAEVIEHKNLGATESAAPSWAEITYVAFDIPSPEFHNELWGYLQVLTKKDKMAELNKLLMDLGVPTAKRQWQRDDKPNSKPENSTLSYFIRSAIHHPENKYYRQGPAITEDELRLSTKQLLMAIEKYKADNINSQP